MLGGLDGATVYLACGSTDLRKSIDGLAATVTHSFELDLFANSLFVFCNRSRDKLKILFWDCNGITQRVLALLSQTGARSVPLARSHRRADARHRSASVAVAAGWPGSGAA